MGRGGRICEVYDIMGYEGAPCAVLDCHLMYSSTTMGSVLLYCT